MFGQYYTNASDDDDDDDDDDDECELSAADLGQLSGDIDNDLGELTWDVILLCTEPDSLMQRHNPFEGHARVHDITIDDDFTSEKGYLKVKNLILDNPRVAVVASFPCTGGCTFNSGINLVNPKCWPKIKAHWALFNKLWKQYDRLCDEVREQVGVIPTILEWPRRCKYWMLPKVMKRQEKWNG